MLTQVGDILTTENPSAIQSPENTALQKDDFLKLLIAQIQNQDPIDPINPKELTEQLTALAELEQTYNFTDTLKQFGEVIESLNKTNLLSLLGRKVKVEGNLISADGSISAEYTLPENAELVKIRIVDKTGQTVKEWEIPGQNAGTHVVLWDGKDEYGNPLNGTFWVEVEATTNGSIMKDVILYSTGTVTSVNLREEAITIGNKEFPINNIVEVSS